MNETLEQEKRKLNFTKGDEVYIIDYKVGRETEVLAHLLEMANNPELSFDFFDGLLLAYQMRRGK